MGERSSFALERFDSPRHSSRVAQLFSLGCLSVMRFILLLIFSTFLAGCAARHEASVTRLPKPAFYAGSIVPLSAYADIDVSVSKSEVEQLQKILASERDGGDATIDSIHKKRDSGGDIVEVRRSIYFWQFKHTADGQWLLLSHGDWYS